MMSPLKTTKRFSYERRLDGRYYCLKCGRSYNALKNLRYHARNVCGQPPKYLCQLCHHSSHHKCSFKKHMKILHGVDTFEL